MQYLVYKAINWSYDTVTYNEETNTLKCEDSYEDLGGDKEMWHLAMDVAKNGGKITII